MLNLRKFGWQALLLIAVTLGLLFGCLPSAGADEIPPSDAPTVSEPSPEEEVQPQLPEEVIGRQITCPDGSVGRVISSVGNTDCPVVREPAVRTPEPTRSPMPTATPTPEPSTAPSQTPSASPTPTPSTTPTPTPLPDCTDPMVECSCDHFIGGCTGGNPPDGEGTPFPGASAETDVDEQAKTTRTTEAEVFLYGGAIVGLLVLCVSVLVWDHRRTR